MPTGSHLLDLAPCHDSPISPQSSVVVLSILNISLKESYLYNLRRWVSKAGNSTQKSHDGLVFEKPGIPFRDLSDDRSIMKPFVNTANDTIDVLRLLHEAKAVPKSKRGVDIEGPVLEPFGQVEPLPFSITYALQEDAVTSVYRRLCQAKRSMGESRGYLCFQNLVISRISR